MFSSRFVARCANALRSAQRQQTRKMGSNAHHDHHHDHHDHHHGPAPDTAYDPELNRKFNLPPIPKDGIYRRPRVDMNAYGPWHRSQDIYMRDPTDMAAFFDRNGPLSISPQRGAVHFLGFFGALTSIYFIPHYIIGEESAPTPSDSRHDGPLAHLVSVPHTKIRPLVAEIV